MDPGHFLWTDLSTYDMAAARADYARLFHWRFQGDAAYDFAILDGQEVAALFPMPEALARIGMPAFWMSYLQVANLDESIATARRHTGVIIEVEPESFSNDARIALVRDPSGAGVTFYEGPPIPAPPKRPGTVAARYHHLPDIRLIDQFYADLFGWCFEQIAREPWPAYAILDPGGRQIATAEEVPEAIRGTYRYWMPSFRVTSVQETLQTLAQIEGKRLVDLPGGRVMAADRQGAHFMIGPDPALGTD